MQYIRCTNTAIIPYLKPLLMPDDDVSLEQTIMQIEQALVYAPRNIWLTVCLGECLECKGVGYHEEALVKEREGKLIEMIKQNLCKKCQGLKDPQIYGFILAIAPEGFSYVHINQCWIDSSAAGLKITPRFDTMLNAWAESIGRTKVRMETKRDPKGFIRRYGFRAISTIMERDLDVKELGMKEQENNHGIEEQRTEEYLDLDRTSAGSNGPTLEYGNSEHSGTERETHGESEPEPESHRTGSDSVQSADRAESSPTIPAGDESDPGVQSERIFPPTLTSSGISAGGTGSDASETQSHLAESPA